MNNEFDKYAVKHLGIGSNLLNDYKNFQSKIENSLTPYILEEREMRMTQMDIFSRLMRDRIIWVAGAINDSVSTVVQAQLLYLADVDPSKDVTLHLDTPGGSVKSGLSMIDLMNYVPYDIATINTGMCASMGSVLLAAGTKGKRSSLRFSKVMTHQVSHGTQGHIEDTRINQREAEKYNYILFQLLGQYSGKTWKEVLEHSKRDRWYSADEAKEFGFIDEIILKDGEKSVAELLKGFDEYKKYTEED
jgi:ATP-dependent Clp protease protease subunit